MRLPKIDKLAVDWNKLAYTPPPDFGTPHPNTWMDWVHSMAIWQSSLLSQTTCAFRDLHKLDGEISGCCNSGAGRDCASFGFVINGMDDS